MQIDQRPHEIVPHEDGRENGQRRQRGLGQRQHDPEVDAVFTQAVDAGRIQDLVRDADEELAQQENAKGGERLQKDERQMVVNQTDLSHQDELRDHIDLPGDGKTPQVGQEKEVPTLEVQFGEGIGSETAGSDLEKRDDDGKLEGVEEERQERNPRPDGLIVAPARILGNPLNGEAEDVFVQLQGGGGHPDERQDHDYRQRNQHGVGEHPRDRAPPQPGPIGERAVPAEAGACGQTGHLRCLLYICEYSTQRRSM